MSNKLISIKVKLNIPLLGGVEAKWKPNNAEKDAAWELYVELVTRISVVELRGQEGTLSEALNSLYSLFKTTRDILKKYGPEVAHPLENDRISFGKLAVTILNYQLRPLLAEWHPKLDSYLQHTDQCGSICEHEAHWDHNEELREKISETRKVLRDYSNLLAKVAKVDLLYEERELEGGSNGNLQA
jgi:hypothetical protein